MTIERILIRDRRLDRATEAEVDELDAVSGIELPPGYREYVTTLGEGCLSDWVRIYPPWRILGGLLDEYRQLMAQYWFWDEGPPVLTQSQAAESTPVGDTLDGDWLVFHPALQLHFVLPRHSENIFIAGSNLFDALDWLCLSGILTNPIESLEFEPFSTRINPHGLRPGDY